jgi:ribosomal protein L19E
MEQFATKEDILRIEGLLKQLIAKTTKSSEDESNVWVDTREAMSILKLTSKTRIYQLIKQGRIKRSKTTGVKGNNRYNKADLLKVVQDGLG